MRAGGRNKIIEIQQPSVVLDGWGGSINSWATFATVWARVQPIKGRELIASMAAQSEITTIFSTQYIADVNQDMRIVYGGKYYNITAVIDVEEAHRELQIMASTGLNEG